jgi:hypothetical protein
VAAKSQFRQSDAALMVNKRRLRSFNQQITTGAVRAISSQIHCGCEGF